MSSTTAILIERDRLLLVETAVRGRSWEKLWSLPSGEVGEHENPESAIQRIIREECDLQVDVLERIPPLRKTSFDLSIFHTSKVALSAKIAGASFDRFHLFNLSQLPERMDIDSLLCLLEFQISRSDIGQHVSTVIDKVFSAVFYSYLNAEFDGFNFDAESEVYRYIITSTPHRKFKSVVPFLLSNCSQDKRHLFLVPELCFAIWTLLDDCYDKKLYRYEVETALKRFGFGRSVIALFKSVSHTQRVLKEVLPSAEIRQLCESLLDSASALYERSMSSPDFSIDDYLHLSSRRTRFLREAWRAVLTATGYDSIKTALIYSIQQRSSILGQLINDYFDIQRGGLEDFTNRVVSMHSLLLYQESNAEDRSLLLSLWLDSSATTNNYGRLLAKYNIQSILHKRIADMLDDIIKRIHASEFNKDEKRVLIAWHEMSFVHFKRECNDIESLRDLLESVDRLLDNP